MSIPCGKTLMQIPHMDDPSFLRAISMERCTSSSRIYDGRVINLRVDQVVAETGRPTTREVVEHRGAAAIVPVLDKDSVVLVRQYRYAIASDLLEIPAGTLERGESPMDCAKRELEEETGYKCGELEKILECYIAPGYSTEKIHFFMARQLVRTKMRNEEDEQIKIEVMPIVSALEKIRCGKIQDAKTVCALYRAIELISPGHST
jgi:ADP-ribose pyrophosphatase